MKVEKTHKIMVLVALSCLLLVLSLAGACTKATPTPAPSPSPTPAEPIKIRYSGILPVTAQTSKEMIAFGELVTERTQGQVQVETYVAKELYDSFESIDVIKAGGIEMINCGTTIWAGWNPIFEYGNIFFLQSSADQFNRARDKLTAIIDPLYQAHNAKIVNYYYYGNVGIASKMPVKEVVDLKGLKIRGTGIACNENIDTLGAVATRMSSSDVYDALGKGAIDGAVSGWSTFAKRKWYEVADYFLGPVYFASYASWINTDIWNSIPKDLQSIIMECAQETEAQSYAACTKAGQENLDTLRGGGTLHLFTAEEMKKWSEAVAPVTNNWINKCKEKGLESEAREIIKILEEAR